jgi:hypothetical protein
VPGGRLRAYSSAASAAASASSKSSLSSLTFRLQHSSTSAKTGGKSLLLTGAYRLLRYGRRPSLRRSRFLERFAFAVNHSRELPDDLQEHYDKSEFGHHSEQQG